MGKNKSEYLLKAIATNVKRLRELNQISQFELALRSGCSRTQISRIENCEVNPTILLLNDIAKSLNTDIFELLEEK